MNKYKVTLSGYPVFEVEADGLTVHHNALALYTNKGMGCPIAAFPMDRIVSIVLVPANVPVKKAKRS